MIGRIVLAASVACLMGGVAAAQPAPRDAPTKVVAYGDLNLATAAGRASLSARLSTAARRLCGPQPALTDLGGLDAYRACIRATTESIRPSIDEAAALQAGSRMRTASGQP